MNCDISNQLLLEHHGMSSNKKTHMRSPRQHLIIEVGVLYPLQDQLIFQKKIKKLIEKIELVNYIKICNMVNQLLKHQE